MVAAAAQEAAEQRLRFACAISRGDVEPVDAGVEGGGERVQSVAGGDPRTERGAAKAEARRRRRATRRARARSPAPLGRDDVDAESKRRGVDAKSGARRFDRFGAMRAGDRGEVRRETGDSGSPLGRDRRMKNAAAHRPTSRSRQAPRRGGLLPYRLRSHSSQFATIRVTRPSATVNQGEGRAKRRRTRKPGGPAERRAYWNEAETVV